jgi:TonB family protein
MEMDKEGKGTGTEKEFFKSGAISQIGQFSKGYKKDGVWEYFYRDGKIAYRETYDKGKIISQTGFDHAGNVIKDCPAHSMPVYHRGMNKLNRYLANHIHFPPKYRATGEIIAEFIVDTSGKVNNIRIVKSLPPTYYGDEAVKAYNLAVTNALEKMPDWTPGMDHNRKVKVYYVIPVKFKLD